VRHRKADFSGRRVGVVLSGGNVDLARLSEYIAARRSL
jgi:threonine dehydratase